MAQYVLASTHSGLSTDLSQLVNGGTPQGILKISYDGPTTSAESSLAIQASISSAGDYMSGSIALKQVQVAVESMGDGGLLVGRIAGSGLVEALTVSGASVGNILSITSLSPATLGWVAKPTGTVTSVGLGQGATDFTISGSPVTTSGNLSITLNTVNTGKGGLGLTTYTGGDTVYYASGTALSKLAIGNQFSLLGSTGTAPAWMATTTPTTGQVPTFNGTTIVWQTPSGSSFPADVYYGSTNNFLLGNNTYDPSTNVPPFFNVLAIYQSAAGDILSSATGGLGGGAILIGSPGSAMTTVGRNTVVGVNSVNFMQDATQNTILGYGSGNGLISGVNNTLLGDSCGLVFEGGSNLMAGQSTGLLYAAYDQCVLLGVNCDTTATGQTNAIGIGYGVTASSNTAVIGHAGLLGLGIGSPTTVGYSITVGGAGTGSIYLPQSSSQTVSGSGGVYSVNASDQPVFTNSLGSTILTGAFPSYYANTNFIFGPAGNGVTSGNTSNTLVWDQSGNPILPNAALFPSTPTDNILIGSAGTALTAGQYNTFIGINSANLLDSGMYNVVVGNFGVGMNTVNGLRNTIIGSAAQQNGDYLANTLVGAFVSSMGDNNTILGDGGLCAATVTNSTAIGQAAAAYQSNIIQLGNNSVTGISIGVYQDETATIVAPYSITVAQGGSGSMYLPQSTPPTLSNPLGALWSVDMDNQPTFTNNTGSYKLVTAVAGTANDTVGTATIAAGDTSVTVNTTAALTGVGHSFVQVTIAGFTGTADISLGQVWAPISSIVNGVSFDINIETVVPTASTVLVNWSIINA